MTRETRTFTVKMRPFRECRGCCEMAYLRLYTSPGGSCGEWASMCCAGCHAHYTAHSRQVALRDAWNTRPVEDR